MRRFASSVFIGAVTTGLRPAAVVKPCAVSSKTLWIFATTARFFVSTTFSVSAKADRDVKKSATKESDEAEVRQATDELESVQAFLAACKFAKETYGYSYHNVVSVVNDWLAVGARPDSSLLDYRTPSAAESTAGEGAGSRKVTHIINCLKQSDVAPEIVDAFGDGSPDSHLLTLDIADDSDDEKLREKLPVVAEFVRRALDSGAPEEDAPLIYVHCRSGVNRAPSVAMAALVAAEGTTLKDAYDQVVKARPAVRPKYMKEAALFEEDVLKKESSVPALRDGPDSKALSDMYYGLLKDDYSEVSRPGVEVPKKQETEKTEEF